MAKDCVTSTLSTATQKAAFRGRLLAWYAKHARDLAWRQTRDPYRIWLSEIMLQQTTVAMATPHFERFVTAFPTVQDLAAADEQTILRMWEGLGYYRRARNLHAAARHIVAELNGQFPRDVPALMRLPGVGRYTAGAIASFAFDVRAPIVEANTSRVLARLTAYEGDPASTQGQRHLWKTAESLLPQRGAGRFNYALMELGALVCKPAQPLCEKCPVARHCIAFQRGVQNEVPRFPAKQKPTAVHEAAIVVYKSGRVLLRQRRRGERWELMWDFPRFELEAEGPLFAREEIVSKVRSQSGIVCEPGNLLTTIRHGVTRFRITLDCYEAQFRSGRVSSTGDAPTRWVQPSRLNEFPLSVSARRLASLL
jgi:A/G-specific adenine glycosylase